MPEKSEFEKKLAAEAGACRRCVAALDKVDPAAQRRIIAWLTDNYAPTAAAAPASDDA